MRWPSNDVGESRSWHSRCLRRRSAVRIEHTARKIAGRFDYPLAVVESLYLGSGLDRRDNLPIQHVFT